ncbi:phospholipase D-like domain-containing protein DpdK [Vibrio splendidus]
MTSLNSRRIITKTFAGKKQIKDVITSIVASEILNPREIWLVSAWISNFDLVDNRAGAWDVLNPSWGHRTLTFFEVLETVVSAGCKVNVVMRDDEINASAINELRTKLSNYPNFRLALSQELHAKGLFTKDASLTGSMNFTYSGMNKNEELMTLDRSIDDIGQMFNTHSISYPMDEPGALEAEESEEEDDDDEISFW